MEGRREANRAAAALSLPRRFYAPSSRKATAAVDPPNGKLHRDLCSMSSQDLLPFVKTLQWILASSYIKSTAKS